MSNHNSQNTQKRSYIVSNFFDAKPQFLSNFTPEGEILLSETRDLNNEPQIDFSTIPRNQSFSNLLTTKAPSVSNGQVTKNDFAVLSRSTEVIPETTQAVSDLPNTRLLSSLKLASLGKKSRISSSLLQLSNSLTRSSATSQNQRNFLTFNSSGTKIAIRVTSGNVTGLLPYLKKLGFEVTSLLTQSIL